MGHLLRRLLDNERAASELRRLDPIALADLGIRRSEIRAYVQGRLPAGTAPLDLPRRLPPVLRVIDGDLSPLAPRRRAAPRLRLAAARA